MVKTLAAILGLMTAVVGIAFALDPALRPDPRTRQAASLQAVAVDKGTVWDYARRLGDNSPLAFPDACAPGNIVYIQENIEGFKSRHTVLRFVTYDAATGARIDDPGTHSTMQGENTLALASGAPSDQSVSLSWVEWPLHPHGRYFVRFELFDGDVFLGLANTRPFTVTAKQRRAALDSCLAAHASGHAPAEGGLVEGRIGSAAGGFDWGRWLPLAGIAVFACALGVLIGRRRRGPSGETGDE
jgi:hypothetical protein